MSDIIGYAITLIIVSTTIYGIRKGRDERGRLILSHPTSLAFSFLLLGLTVIRLLDGMVIEDESGLRMALDIVMVTSLILYLLLILMKRRRFS